MPTKVEWADESWSPVTGCTKVSPGCANCYAERMARRLAGRYGYPKAPKHFDVTLHPDRLEQPLRWRKPRRIFIPSMGDLFHKNVPLEFMGKVFATMIAADWHTFHVLTKRSARMQNFINWFQAKTSLNLRSFRHIQLGVSVESPDYLWRIDELMKCPATVRFVSLEPLLGPIDLRQWFNLDSDGKTGEWIERPGPGLDWIIVGGESGPGARPMHPDWARSIRDQCRAASVPLFFKQWGEWVARDLYDGERTNNEAWGCLDAQGLWYPETTTWNGRQFHAEDDYECTMLRVGKRHAGHLLDGRLWEEYPRRS